MFDIFGEPDWLALVGGIFSDLLSGFLEGLNWLSFLVPFWLSASASSYFRSKNAPNWIVVLVTLLVFLLALAAYYVVYPYIGFPYWMRWIPR